MGELKPPLNDSHWLLLRKARELRQRQIGDREGAYADLERAMASGELPSMRQNIASGKREHVAAASWTTVALNFGPKAKDRPFSARRISILAKSVHQAEGRASGWVHYVWQPIFDELYPCRAPAEQPLRPIDRAEAVLRHLYPTKAKMPLLNAATSAVEEQCERWGWKPVNSPDTVHRAAVKLGYRLPRKR
jgi:hypothetical protein